MMHNLIVGRIDMPKALLLGVAALVFLFVIQWKHDRAFAKKDKIRQLNMPFHWDSINITGSRSWIREHKEPD